MLHEFVNEICTDTMHDVNECDINLRSIIMVDVIILDQ